MFRLSLAERIQGAEIDVIINSQHDQAVVLHYLCGKAPHILDADTKIEYVRDTDIKQFDKRCLLIFTNCLTSINQPDTIEIRFEYVEAIEKINAISFSEFVSIVNVLDGPIFSDLHLDGKIENYPPVVSCSDKETMKQLLKDSELVAISTDGIITVFELNMDWFSGIEFVKKLGFEQSNCARKAKTFYVSCGKVCFYINERDAGIIYNHNLCPIRLLVDGGFSSYFDCDEKHK